MCVEKDIEIIPMQKLVTVLPEDTFGISKILPDYVVETTLHRVGVKAKLLNLIARRKIARETQDTLNGTGLDSLRPAPLRDVPQTCRARLGSNKVGDTAMRTGEPGCSLALEQRPYALSQRLPLGIDRGLQHFDCSGLGKPSSHRLHLELRRSLVFFEGAVDQFRHHSRQLVPVLDRDLDYFHVVPFLQLVGERVRVPLDGRDYDSIRI